ncbi:MAG: lysophospholipid acyltransferase family protein [Actinomycetales bacterium]
MTGPRRVGAYRVVCGLIDVVLRLVCRTRADLSALPRRGPLLVVANHLSVADPLVVAAALNRHGLVPRFVITAGVMRHPLVGPILRYFDHIPLDRDARGPGALDAIVAALRRDECVVIYPEGKVAVDVATSPGKAQPGAVTAAAAAGAPVALLAQWGSQDIYHYGSSTLRRVLPRRAVVHLLADAPRPVAAVGLREQLRVHTELMSRLRRLVDTLRPLPITSARN